MPLSKNFNLLDDKREDRASSKRILIMCGCYGAGKTTIARRIQRAFYDNCVIIHRDVFRSLQSVKEKFFLYNHFSPDEEEVDKQLLDRTEELLGTYQTIILDATFRTYSKRQMVYKFAQQHNCEIIVIHCTCSYETAKQRLERQIYRGEKTLYCQPDLLVEHFQKNFEEPIHESESAAATIIKVDTEQNTVTTTVQKDKSLNFVNKLLPILRFLPHSQISEKNDWLEAPLYCQV